MYQRPWWSQGKAFVSLFELQAELATFHRTLFLLETLIDRQTMICTLEYRCDST